MRARRFPGSNFYFDRASLTRLEDFWKVHCCASSARLDVFDLQVGIACVANLKSPNERFVLRLFAELYGLGRRNQLGRFAWGRTGHWLSTGLNRRRFALYRWRRDIRVIRYYRAVARRDRRRCVAVRRLRGVVVRRRCVFGRGTRRHQHHYQNG